MCKPAALLIAFILCTPVVSCGPSPPESADSSSTSSKSTIPTGPKVTCPVCGLTFSQSDAVGSVRRNNKTYYFYLEDHLKAFEADPAPYLEE